MTGRADLGAEENENEEGWDLRTGEVEAQRAFLQLLELTDVVDEPGRFFNDDTARAARVIAEGTGRRRAGRSDGDGDGDGDGNGSGGPTNGPLVLLPFLHRQQQQQQQQQWMGQPRQRRRSTLSMETTATE
jgi:hypothetical protein